MELLEPVEHPESVLCAQAVANGLLSLLDAFLEPAAVAGQLLPGAPPVLLAADVVLGHLLQERHLRKQGVATKILSK